MSSQLRVAIVGGGIGGLSAATFLIRQGIEVRVYEKSHTLGEVGAGLTLSPNARRLLHRLGMQDELEAVGGDMSGASTFYRKDGTRVAPMTLEASDGIAMLGMHRADLLEIFARQLPDGVVETGHECTDFQQLDTCVRLVFANGRTAEADIVVGADGIRSRMREVIASPAKPIHSGSIAFRGLIEADRLPEWQLDAFQVWMGDGREHFMTYPVRANRMINYVAFLPSTDQIAESWSSAGDPQVLRAAFVSWDPRVTYLLARIERCFWWGLYDREPFEPWSHGRVTLLGDAAHPMLPHLGQGANQSIEDGAALAALLRGRSVADAMGVLGTYEALRRERVTVIQDAARHNGQRYDGAYADQRQRDAEIKASGELRRWIYDYDVVEALKDQMDHG
jgi:salicylate hydroxylase